MGSVMPERELADPPDWGVEMLQLQVQGRTPAASVSVPGDAVLGVNGEPPLDIDRDVWQGKSFANDRSAGLWAIAGELAAAGANEATIVEALRERDETLGWSKYTNRSDREQRYVEAARRQLANVTPRIKLGAATTTTPTAPASTVPPPIAWPAPLENDAFHGPLGTVVRGIEPHSEADPAALLAHAIVVASAYIGSRAHARAGDSKHPPRFYAGVVGDTSKGRKGTSAAPYRQAMVDCDEPVRIASGLSSSEGLVYQVRDRIQKWNARDQAFEITDPGVTDKRLAIFEPEYAAVLRRMEREGNAISQTLRDAWDHGDLETLVKLNPTKATGAHIAIVAHITLDELHEYLLPTEISSGSANRFLWFAVKRSKFLPRGGNAPRKTLIAFAEALDKARKWAVAGLPGDGLLDFSEAAGKRWDALYEQLSTGGTGVFGKATQRAEAQVLRLGVLYAVLDCSASLELAHLNAALAVWRYCQDSARWVFGTRTGNALADTIVAGLRSSGELTRTEISGLFSRHVKADRISDALHMLLRDDLAVMERRGGGAFQGPATEFWRAK